MRTDKKADLAELAQDLRALAISSDVAAEVEAALKAGLELPLERGEAEALVCRIIEVMREGARKRGDLKTAQGLDQDVRRLLDEILERRYPASPGPASGEAKKEEK